MAVSAGSANSGGRASARGDGPNWARAFHLKTGQGPYGIQELSSTLGLSRTTLLYYESLGIVKPERTEGAGRRQFGSQDIFRLIGATMLKNVGIPPRELAQALEDDPFAPERLDEYAERARRRIAYIEAQMAALSRLTELKRGVGTMEVVDVARYYIYFDRAETGFHDYPANGTLDLLLEHAPIGSLGCLYDCDYLTGDFSVRSGRTVPVADAPLIDGLVDIDVEKSPVIGGMRCLCSIELFANPYSEQDSSLLEDQRRRVRRYLSEHGLEVAGPAFNPYSLCSGDGLYLPLCIPVREK